MNHLTLYRTRKAARKLLEAEGYIIGECNPSPTTPDIHLIAVGLHRPKLINLHRQRDALNQSDLKAARVHLSILQTQVQLAISPEMATGYSVEFWISAGQPAQWHRLTGDD